MQRIPNAVAATGRLLTGHSPVCKPKEHGMERQMGVYTLRTDDRHGASRKVGPGVLLPACLRPFPTFFRLTAVVCQGYIVRA
jgi:hypothetical protein